MQQEDIRRFHDFCKGNGIDLIVAECYDRYRNDGMPEDLETYLQVANKTTVFLLAFNYRALPDDLPYDVSFWYYMQDRWNIDCLSAMRDKDAVRIIADSKGIEVGQSTATRQELFDTGMKKQECKPSNGRNIKRIPSGKEIRLDYCGPRTVFSTELSQELGKLETRRFSLYKTLDDRMYIRFEEDGDFKLVDAHRKAYESHSRRLFHAIREHLGICKSIKGAVIAEIGSIKRDSDGLITHLEITNGWIVG